RDPPPGAPFFLQTSRVGKNQASPGGRPRKEQTPGHHDRQPIPTKRLGFSVVLQDLLRNYAFSNPDIVRLLIVSAVAFGFGYWVYIYCIRLLIRERKSPYPVWMHTFYLACDATGTVFWFLLAKEHGWFWFFTASSVAMLIWVFCELWSLY